MPQLKKKAKQRKESRKRVPQGQRFQQTAKPPRAKTVGEVLVRTRHVLPVSVEDSGWNRVPDMEKLNEERTLTVTLADGRVFKFSGTIRYKKGQRERIMEAMVGKADDKETKWALRETRKILGDRARASERMYAQMQKKVGGGVPVG